MVLYIAGKVMKYIMPFGLAELIRELEFNTTCSILKLLFTNSQKSEL